MNPSATVRDPGRREFLRQGAGLGVLALLPGALGAAGPAPTAAPGGFSPYEAGNRAQLFVDDFLIAASARVSRTAHLATKHPGNPLVVADQPWERAVQMYGDVLYDDEERRFKMWYIADTGELYDQRYNTCYATSPDGIRWEKPLPGTVPSRTGAPTNVVMRSVELPSVFKDPAEPDPARRYKAICWIDGGPDRGALTMVSPDGVRWSRCSPGRIFECSDVVTGFHDRVRGRYVALAKDFAELRGNRRRVFKVSTSEDFVHWTDPQPALYPDLRDDAGSLGRIERVRGLLCGLPDDPQAMRTEFYGAGFYPAESATLVFPWIFTINRNNTTTSSSNEGSIEVHLGVTRDLRTWERPFRASCLPLGGAGDWDEGMVMTQGRAFRVGDEIRLYYSGFPYLHGHSQPGGGIGLARWPLDRFVSVDGPEAGGTLTTIPLTFAGDRLELNAAVAAGGALTVEPVDLLGRPLPGFGPSEPVEGDALRHAVRWRHGQIGRLQGRPVCLRFNLRRAQLFTFAFRGGAAAAG